MSTKPTHLSSQDLLVKAARARRRFKALVRKVINNIHWLSMIDDEVFWVNIRKNIKLIRMRRAKKSLLTMQEKGILCKPAEYRTEEEKEYLYRIIGDLKCFRKYPENVKIQLAAVTYFIYFPAGRVIVKQYHEAHTMYYILSGEVHVSVTSVDPVTREEVTNVIGNMVAGSLFGEVALLHDIPRTATVTTTTPCEFLYLKKADFDIVLKSTVSRQWDDIQKAMCRFTYFQDWDELAIRECCIYSKIKPFVRNQTILGDGVGLSSSAYFILRGQCKIIEQLMVEVHYDKHGKKQYSLYEELTKASTQEKILLDEDKQSTGSADYKQTTAVQKKFSAFQQKQFRISNKSVLKQVHNQRSIEKSKHSSLTSVRAQSSSSQNIKLKPAFTKSSKLIGKSVTSKIASKSPFDEYEDVYASESSINIRSNIETHFMQVCVFNETACFGIGENLKHRRVIAMSDWVECLLVPRYWLLQKNKGNIWLRIKQFLDKQIPSTRQVFEEFLAQREWFNYRRDVVKSLVAKPPVNAYYNIPYSIRINEDINFREK